MGKIPSLWSINHSSKEKHNKQAGQAYVKTLTCAYFLPGSIIIQWQDPTYDSMVHFFHLRENTVSSASVRRSAKLALWSWRLEKSQHVQLYLHEISSAAAVKTPGQFSLSVMALAEWWCQCSVISSAVGHRLMLAVYSSVISQGLLKSFCHIWSDFFSPKLQNQASQIQNNPCQEMYEELQPSNDSTQVTILCNFNHIFNSSVFFYKVVLTVWYSHFHVNFGLSFPTRKPAGFCSELLSVCKSIWEEFTRCCQVSP